MCRRAIFLALIFGIVSSRAETSVVFLDNTHGQYFQQGLESKSLTGNLFTTTVTNLLNLPSTSNTPATANDQIREIIKSSPFDAPHALLSLTIAGLESGREKEFLISSAAIFDVDQNDFLRNSAELQNSKNAEVISLDASSLPGCAEACLEELLQNALNHVGLKASYKPSQAVFRGNLTLGETTFDLNNVSDRLFAMEIASFWATVEDTAIERQRRMFQDPGQYKTPQILLRALISPQALKETYGPNSAQYASGSSLIKNLISVSIQRLQTAYNDRLAGVLAFLSGDNLERSESLLQMLSTSSLVQSRRRLLADSGDSPYLESFIAWIAMWGTFLLLLFFAIAGCHCLKSMKFKQDSLLYGGKNKSD